MIQQSLFSGFKFKQNIKEFWMQNRVEYQANNAKCLLILQEGWYAFVK